MRACGNVVYSTKGFECIHWAAVHTSEESKAKNLRLIGYSASPVLSDDGQLCCSNKNKYNGLELLP